MERKYLIQWLDPTADEAIYGLDHKKPAKVIPLHRQVELRIHGLKQQLAQGKINHVQYKDGVTEQRRLLKRLKKKAR